MNVVIVGHFLQRQHLPVTASVFRGAIRGFVPRLHSTAGVGGWGGSGGVWGFIGEAALEDEFTFTDLCRLC